MELSQSRTRLWSFSAHGYLPAAKAGAIPYFSAAEDTQLARLEVIFNSLNSSTPGARLMLDTVTANETGRRIVEPLWVNEGSGQGPSCFDESMVASGGAARD